MNRYEMEPILNPTGRFVIYGDAMHTIEKLEAQVAELKSAGRTARDDATSALDLLSRVRFALGDNGKRMQPELLGYCAELRDAKIRIQQALGNGADESAWPPGTTWIEAACRIIRESGAEAHTAKSAKDADSGVEKPPNG